MSLLLEKEISLNLQMVVRAHVTRPKNPEQVTDREWAEYVCIRSNPKGIYYERWVHTRTDVKNGLMPSETHQLMKYY